MPDKPKRNREYVIVAAAVLGIGSSACCRTDNSEASPTKAPSAKGAPAKPPPAAARPAPNRMGH